MQRDGQPVDELNVRVQLVNPALERRGVRHVAEGSGDGLYVAAGDEIARAGEWWLLVDLADAPGETNRAAFVVPIREDAALQLTRPPNAFNLIALVLGIGSVVFALRTAVGRFWHWLKPSPLGLLVAALAIGLAAAAIMGAVWLSALSAAQTEASLYPVPQLANPVLPDADSLRRGAAAFDAACGWDAQPRDLQALTERLDRLRDEELFAFTRDGWRALPTCAADLSDADRWDIVNYVRSLSP